MTKLVGKELLEKVQMFGNMSVEECARATGYVSEAGRVLEKQYLLAVLQANGIHQAEAKNKALKKPSSPSGEISVHGNGQTVVGKNYLEFIGLKPGDRINVSIKRGKVILEKIGEESEDDEPKLKAA